jgi:hypothetical protein
MGKRLMSAWNYTTGHFIQLRCTESAAVRRAEAVSGNIVLLTVLTPSGTDSFLLR